MYQKRNRLKPLLSQAIKIPTVHDPSTCTQTREKHTHTHPHTHVCTHIHTHTHVHTHTHTERTHTYTHTHTQINKHTHIHRQIVKACVTCADFMFPTLVRYTIQLSRSLALALSPAFCKFSRKHACIVQNCRRNFMYKCTQSTCNFPCSGLTCT